MAKHFHKDSPNTLIQSKAVLLEYFRPKKVIQGIICFIDKGTSVVLPLNIRDFCSIFSIMAECLPGALQTSHKHTEHVSMTFASQMYFFLEY